MAEKCNSKNFDFDLSWVLRYFVFDKFMSLILVLVYWEVSVGDEFFI
jgi:hypothetical protein